MNSSNHVNKLPGACCPEQPTGQSKSSVVPDSFLPASYFLVMLLALSALPEVLVTGRLSGSSHTLLALGLWSINGIIFCLVSFLYYSESEHTFKTLFANLRMFSLSAVPLLFWWALYKNNPALQSFEWSVVFGLSASLFLIFIGFAIQVQQKQLLTSYLFLASVLLCYGGAVMLKINHLTLASYLVVAGLLSLATFTLQTQSEFKNKCKNVEVFLLLSLILQWLAVNSTLSN